LSTPAPGAKDGAMKICVYGAGAVGGHVAARLARGGADVSIIARAATAETVRKRGLHIKTLEGGIHAQVAVPADARELGPQDVVIVTVKAPSLPAAAAGIVPLLGPRTAVVFAMNGLPWWFFHRAGGPLDGRRLPLIDPDDVIWQTVGPERVIGAVVNTACVVLEPGVIQVTNRANRFVLGEPGGSASPRVDALAQTMRAGGFIRDDVWEKLIGNVCGAPFMVLTHMKATDVYNDPACEAAIRSIMAETSALGAALGCNVRLDPERLVASGKALHHKSSMAQDLELGRAMEIDSFFTAPLALARELGVATPTLDLFAALVKLRARSAGLYRG
jgi:2-dehydropantoate 2-reductase